MIIYYYFFRNKTFFIKEKELSKEGKLEKQKVGGRTFGITIVKIYIDFLLSS